MGKLNENENNIEESVFENITPITAIKIKREIEYSINRYEPRVILTEVDVSPNYDGNAFDVLIAYNVVGIDVPTQQLDFVLQSTSQ